MTSLEDEDNVEKEISEIAEHVDVIVESDNLNLNNINKIIKEIELEEENLGIQENEQMDKILKRSFEISKNIENLEDKKEKINRALSSASEDLEKSGEHDNALRSLKEHESRLAGLKFEIDKIKSESKEIQSVAENVPKLSQNKKLYYSLSRITLDKTVSDDSVKGFVVNPRKDDVHAFDFKLSDDDQVMGQGGVSNYFVSNYLWDLIAAASQQDWENI